MLRRKRRVGCLGVCSGLSEERREACLYDCDMTGDPEVCIYKVQYKGEMFGYHAENGHIPGITLIGKTETSHDYHVFVLVLIFRENNSS